MAIIPQLKLFEWTEIQTLGDLERLRLVLDHMPDEDLMKTLERQRGKGRNDYPVRAMWNSVLAGIVFQHDNVEKLRRELARNGQLREMCGFDNQVPPSWVYTRYLKLLMKHDEQIDVMFDKLVNQLAETLPDFGKHLAMDSKAISSFAKRKNKHETADGRRETDADYGKKKYSGVHKDGRAWETIVKWFGYKLHHVVDATHELPVAFKLTKASASDMTEGRALLEQMDKRQPELLKKAETLAADRGYDDTKLLTKCWDELQIKPVIDIRNMWRDSDKTRLLEGRENVVYDYKGTVSCVCPETGKQREMCNGGFEKDRNTLKKFVPPNKWASPVREQHSVRLRRVYGFRCRWIAGSLRRSTEPATSGRKSTPSGRR